MTEIPPEYLIEHGPALAEFAEQVDHAATTCDNARWVTNMHRDTEDTEVVGGFPHIRSTLDLQQKADEVSELGKDILCVTARAGMFTLREEAAAYYVLRFMEARRKAGEAFAQLVWSDGITSADRAIPGIGSCRLASETRDDGRKIKLSAFKLEEINGTKDIARRSQMWLEEGDMCRSLSVMACAGEVCDVHFNTTMDNGAALELKMLCLSMFKGAADVVISVLSGDHKDEDLENQLDILRLCAPAQDNETTERLLDIVRYHAINQFEAKAIRQQLGSICLPTMEEISVMTSALDR